MLPIAAGLMGIYLTLRIIRDIGRGYRPRLDEGDVGERGR
jgi:hypothetical protein